MFNCAPPQQCFADALPTRTEPGVFGHIAGYLGAVEPQMRKALHIHMLIQLLGFAHPQDLFGSDVLPDTFKRLWYYVASICFRSTEAFAVYVNEDTAMEKLASLPLLPLSKKQRGIIGETRALGFLRHSYRPEVLP